MAAIASVEPKDVPLPPSRPSSPKRLNKPTSSSSLQLHIAQLENAAQPPVTETPLNHSKRPSRDLANTNTELLSPIASTSRLEIAKEPSSGSLSRKSSFVIPTHIHGIVLVDFDHALGPKVEYSYPTHLQEDEELAANLPFLALPDGAHLRDEDYSYFHLRCPSISESTIFGISCNRQLPSEQLKRRSKVITRSTVQKAIVVLASKPVFGPVRDKLGVVTRAFFAQKDFEETEILVEFYSSLEAGLAGNEILDDNALYMGTSIRELIYKFRFKTLMLLKLLLLQRKVMFYGQNVERLCTFQYSLVSLIPLLLNNLGDAASPELDLVARSTRPPTELRTSDKQSLLKYLGLPLHVFGKGAFFQPYLPLQQIDLLQEAGSYLVGTTNSIFQQQKECSIDVLVNIDTATIDFLDPSIPVLVNLTAPDRKWMDEVVSTVSDTWNAADPARPLGMKFVGSDDYLRGKFEEYLCSALAALKFVEFVNRNGKNSSMLLSPSELSASLASYNEAWLAHFKCTQAFALWQASTDEVIFDLIEPRHPCEGNTNLVQDVGIRLVQGVHDLHLEENLGGAKEVIGKGIQTGTQSVWTLYSTIKSDLGKRQADYKDKRTREASMNNEEPSGSNAAASPTTPAISDTVISGMSEAGTRAATIANSVGSFFSSKRSQFFSPTNRSTSDPIVPVSSSNSAVEMKTPPLQQDEFSTDSTDIDSASVQVTPATNPFASFFRSSPTTQTESNPTIVPPVSSSVPSFFRRFSGPAEAPKSGLKELTLSSSPVFGTDASPKLSPKLNKSPRPNSTVSSNSTRSNRSSKEYEIVNL